MNDLGGIVRSENLCALEENNGITYLKCQAEELEIKVVCQCHFRFHLNGFQLEAIFTKRMVC